MRNTSVVDAVEERRMFFFRVLAMFAFMLGLPLAVHLFAQTEDATPPAQPAAPPQPIPYSHKTHLAFGLKCDDCHQAADPGINVTLPSTARCMECHTAIDADHPAIQTLAQYDKSGKPVPWNRVYTVPSWVFWNHRTHLQAGVQCEACHGNVSQMDVMRVVTNVTVMKGCVDCHDERGAPTGCATCHDDMGTQ